MTIVAMGMPTYCDRRELVDMTLCAIDSFRATTTTATVEQLCVYENAPPNEYQRVLRDGCEKRGTRYVYWKEPFNMNRIYNAVIASAPSADVIVCANNDVTYHPGWLAAARKYLKTGAQDDDSPYVMVEPVAQKRDDDFAETHRKLPERNQAPRRLYSGAGYCLILAGWYARTHSFNEEIAFGGQEHVHRAEIEARGHLSALVSSCYVEHLNQRTKMVTGNRVDKLRKEAEKYWRKYGETIGVR